MLRICAWCKSILNTITGTHGINHSICQKCKKKVLDDTYKYDFEQEQKKADIILKNYSKN